MTAWLAHLYTALGAATALAATEATFAGAFRDAFLWLALAVFIDATDGVLARAVGVKERLPWFSGEALDNLVDYLTYVFVPVLIMMRAEVVPPALAPPLAVAILVASGYGFSRADAKVATTDYFFTGFPSYWNIVVLYLYAWHPSPLTSAVILATLVALVFVPIRYVYPSRTRTWRAATLLLGSTWALLTLGLIWRLPRPEAPWRLATLIFPAYYVVLSLWLSARERAVR